MSTGVYQLSSSRVTRSLFCVCFQGFWPKYAKPRYWNLIWEKQLFSLSYQDDRFEKINFFTR